MTNSRQKGKRGELELVKLLKSLGFHDARRAQQYKGTADSCDVECPDTLPNIHFECKVGYTKKLDHGTELLDAIREKAIVAAGGRKMPVVFWKPDRKCWRMDSRVDEAGEKHWITLDSTESMRVALLLQNGMATQ